MHATPYLNFNGNCREAFEFYRQVLGGEVVMQTNAESPIAEHLPAEQGDLILHARLEADGVVLMASDAPPDRYQKPQGTFVSLHVDTPEEAERIYGGLTGGGSIIMPLQTTFWASRFGMFVDRYGTPWMVNCEVAE
jgi:PhnB protein